MKGGFYMKKIIIVLLILTLAFIATNYENKEVIIPKDSIRFRVIASSDNKKDQENKKIIANNLKEDITNTLKDSKNIEESRLALKSNINEFKANIDETIKTNNINETYTINYGNNYFPEKVYKGVKYKEGDYESLVVTLGDGSGENFWCVLFPPLCLLEGEEIDSDDIEYSSFIKEVIDKYF